jgi:hypothetical protein
MATEWFDQVMGQRYQAILCALAAADSNFRAFEVQILYTQTRAAPGESIRITAVDDVMVKTVGVLIATDDGTLVEKGSAVPVPNSPNQWLYTATTAAPSASVKIVVDVADLAREAH